MTTIEFYGCIGFALLMAIGSALAYWKSKQE